MPALPWKKIEELAPDTEVTVMASRLPLRHHRSIPRFMMWTLRIRRQLAASPGLVGYSLDAQLAGKRFWTVSAWTGNPELRQFNRTDPHRSATTDIGPLMDPTTFVTWTTSAGELPIEWAEVRRRIADADAGAAGR